MSATAPVLAPTSQIPCQNCGMLAPTKWVVFYQNIGMLVTRQRSEVAGHLCRRCIGAYFRSYTLTTLFLGWWGTISLFLTPLILVNNTWRFATSLTLDKPPEITANPDFRLGQKPIVAGAGNLKFKLIYGAVVCVVVLLLVAYNSVGFLEKHWPSLNAKLHGGEITEEADAEYAWNKITEDVTVINSDMKAEDYASRRAEFLAREPYVKDLKLQDGRIQAALAKERDEAHDACVQLVFDELGPGVHDYTVAVEQLMATLHAAPTPNQESMKAVVELEGRVDGAGKRIDAYFSKRKSIGCKE